jgi:hypothetical protein
MSCEVMGTNTGYWVGSVMILLNVCQIVDIPRRQSISEYC